MRYYTIFLILTAFIIQACSHQQSTGSTSLVTDTVKIEKDTGKTKTTIMAVYPQNGNQALTTAIKEYISEQLGGTYSGQLDNADSVISYYCNAHSDSLLKMYDGFGNGYAPMLYYSQVITIAEETNTYVTYTDIVEEFLGGAHGMTNMSGTTFRKSDGRRFGDEILRNTDTQDFHDLLKEGVKQYFTSNGTKINSDEELKAMLLPEQFVEYLPLPKSHPYLTKEGVVFIYQPYEIAPYAAGRPSFTIDYNKIRPYLTQTVIKMLDEIK